MVDTIEKESRNWPYNVCLNTENNTGLLPNISKSK